MSEENKKANVTKTYHTANGALIKGSKVKIQEVDEIYKKVRVSDDVGRLFWVHRKDVQLN